MTRFLKDRIKLLLNKDIQLHNYHNEITDVEHKQILNDMPYKRDMSNEITELSDYIEKLVSVELGQNIKIFNGDLWVRICRPSSISNIDYNPCHRDIYLDFYRNVVNIYLPIVGSNSKSSLLLEPGSHKWNETETRVTSGGTHFRNSNKKYSVDTIVSSKKPLNMIPPNPAIDEMMIFSPYLIHGCATNDNIDTTRISLEVRFIRDDENGVNQEKQFNDFLKTRIWR